MTELTASPRRGRPPKLPRTDADTRELLLRGGLEVLTEQGFSASGIDFILKRVGVPKGSFYHYFVSKEAFGLAILDAYGQYFERKLLRLLGNAEREPLQRIEDFVDEAILGMARYQWRRGCLVGNLGQEVLALPESFRSALQAILQRWQAMLGDCLSEAQERGQISPSADCPALAGYFWIGWEGAVMRARLDESRQPLIIFLRGFLAGLNR